MQNDKGWACGGARQNRASLEELHVSSDIASVFVDGMKAMVLAK